MNKKIGFVCIGVIILAIFVFLAVRGNKKSENSNDSKVTIATTAKVLETETINKKMKKELDKARKNVKSDGKGELSVDASTIDDIDSDNSKGDSSINNKSQKDDNSSAEKSNSKSNKKESSKKSSKKTTKSNSNKDSKTD